MSPARRRAQQPNTTERRIHFYRADTGTQGNRPKPLELRRALQAIDRLPWPATGGGRYWATRDGDSIAAWVDDASGSPQRFRFAHVRRTALPHSEDAGKLSPLALADTAGLYEPTHVCVYENIFAVEFNFYAPRPSRFPQYLKQVLGDRAPSFTLEPIIRHDVAEELDTWRGIRTLELLVRPSYISQVAEADRSLGAALQAQSQVGQAGVLGVVLRPERYQRQNLGGTALRLVQRLSRRNDLRENAFKFRVKGETESGSIAEVDVLEDNLVNTRKVTRLDRSRAVEQRSAYREIAAAYEELRDELDYGPSVDLR